MFRRLAPLALVALLAVPSAPARAEDLAGLRAKVAGAMAATKSFVVTTTAATGFTVTMTFSRYDDPANVVTIPTVGIDPEPAAGTAARGAKPHRMQSNGARV